MHWTKKTLFLHTAKLFLAGAFISLLCMRFIQMLNNDIGTRFSVEDDTGDFPSLNICPTYNVMFNHSLLIDLQDNYTLDDLEKLPSMRALLQPKYMIYKESEM